MKPGNDVVVIFPGRIPVLGGWHEHRRANWEKYR
jgi:hypothetical protein